MQSNMYASASQKKNTMDQSDIQYTLELITDAISDKDWDKVYEVREALTEFLDNTESLLEE